MYGEKNHGNLFNISLTMRLNGMIFALIFSIFIQHIYKIRSQMRAFPDYSLMVENLPG